MNYSGIYFFIETGLPITLARYRAIVFSSVISVILRFPASFSCLSFLYILNNNSIVDSLQILIYIFICTVYILHQKLFFASTSVFTDFFLELKTPDPVPYFLHHQSIRKYLLYHTGHSYFCPLLFSKPMSLNRIRFPKVYQIPPGRPC